MQISVAFDFRCGYSYKAARFLRALEKAGEDVQVDWRPFSLEQVNEEHGEGLWLWEHPEIETGSFLGLAAALWVKQKAPGAFPAFLWRAFGVMHDDGRKIDRDTIRSIANEAGADVPGLEAAIDNGDARALAANEYFDLQRQGVFGTPTFFFPGRDGVYVRLRGQWKDDAHRKRVWNQIQALAAENIVGELKRIHPTDPPPVIANIPL
ncbi:MAG: DsbA family protein [Actinomycetota bacterium]|nr:DsbA family protein [Actinomycetota bacterium]